MSRNRQSSPGSQLKPHIQNDARVEILLFLGIVFWCLLLGTSFQGMFSRQAENVLSLHWDGRALQMVPAEISVSGKSESPKTVPAGVTPFLFQPMPVNFADPQLLATISGIGPELAAQIVKSRNSKGLFTGPHDLLSVPGIGHSRMEQFAPHFSFSVTQ
ncbi:MAG: helix-hairpin-helix domain-containing protein [Proteobacteria bacterium]|nr:helix-hairpin-helix domain-containing protein [Desulfocapsa sp.]MBU3946254.1 helix-hairpin-helix domain-containing protein [Pseudomonadota bacterium]MCG2742466.1 helix-hairpin-helix domain-containing protein [Desulfobacteraceae bacterium]MBU3984801.1 helix-hairpin-helix domain-containing protein [Pseudomonadota bacterium]MBU4044409.1 helix-hairpin-helix domain-containing protein [Pseudomonadota bacterium]